MDKKIILVDMDGPLADFEAGFLKRWKYAYPMFPSVPLAKRNTFYIPDQYPMELREKVWQTITNEGFFLSLPPVAGALEALLEMKQLGNEVFICTSPIKRSDYCLQEKREWLIHYLGLSWWDRTLIVSDKTLVRGDILIDDKPEVRGVMAASWTHYMFECCHNQLVDHPLRVNWNNWKIILG